MYARSLIWFLVFLPIVAGIWRLAPLAARQDSLYQTYAPLIEVDSIIRQRFVEPVEATRLLDGAIAGMMFQLDPYSGYIGPEALSAYKRRAAGAYIGIGVQLGMAHDLLTVIAPIEQSPAQLAGVQAGDVLLTINGHATKGLGVADAERLLEGQAGSTVRLTVRHPGQQQSQVIKVTRGLVNLTSVKGAARSDDGQWTYFIEPDEGNEQLSTFEGIAYLRISHFHENTALEFDRAIAQIGPDNIRGLVLDLRFNPGGSLRSAIQLVDRFCSDGVIVSTVTRYQAKDIYEASRKNTLPPWPLAVLINEFSASAAEIVAGSLQDHDRAVLVGSRSFGKGVVQSIVSLRQRAAALSLTVAHYRLPKGRIIHKTPQAVASGNWGVLPDQVIPLDHLQQQAIQQRRTLLDEFPNQSPEHKRAGVSHPRADDPDTGIPPSILIDPQLGAALQAVRQALGSHPNGQNPQ